MHPYAEDESIEPRVSDPERRSVTAGLFAVWHRTMSSAASHVGRIGPRARHCARAWAHQWSLLRAYHADPAASWSSADPAGRRTAAAVGLRAFLFGLTVTGLSISTSTSLLLPIVVGVGGQVLWAGTRFIIIALLMPPGTTNRARLSVAFLAGLLPYAFAATWVLQLIALAVSAVLTSRGLTGAGVDGHDAHTATTWAFGGQAAIIIGSWAVRAVIVLAVG